MIVGPPLRKQSAEIIPWTVDFASILKTGETISTVTFKAYKLSDSSDVTATLKQGEPAADGTAWTQMVKAGTHETTYILEMEATTNLGQKSQAEIELHVRDIPVPAAP